MYTISAKRYCFQRYHGVSPPRQSGNLPLVVTFPKRFQLCWSLHVPLSSRKLLRPMPPRIKLHGVEFRDLLIKIHSYWACSSASQRAESIRCELCLWSRDSLLVWMEKIFNVIITWMMYSSCSLNFWDTFSVTTLVATPVDGFNQPIRSVTKQLVLQPQLNPLAIQLLQRNGFLESAIKETENREWYI